MTKNHKISSIFLSAILAFGVGVVNTENSNSKIIDSIKPSIPLQKRNEGFDKTTTYYAPATTATLVTDVDALEAGDRIVIAVIDDVKNVTKALGPINSYGTYMTAVDVAIRDSQITTLGDATILTLGGNSGAWTLSIDSQFLYYTGASSELYIGDNTKTTNTWTIVINNEKATIANTEKTGRVIQYNSSSPRFACYTTSQVKPSIYKMDPDESGYNYDYLLEVLKGDYCEMDIDGLDTINTRYEAMTSIEKFNFNGEEITGQDGNTYTGEEAYTQAMIKRAALVGLGSKDLFTETFEQNEIIMTIVIVSLISVSVLGGVFYFRRKEQN